MDHFSFSLSYINLVREIERRERDLSGTTVEIAACLTIVIFFLLFKCWPLFLFYAFFLLKPIFKRKKVQDKLNCLKYKLDSLIRQFKVNSS